MKITWETNESDGPYPRPVCGAVLVSKDGKVRRERLCVQSNLIPSLLEARKKVSNLESFQLINSDPSSKTSSVSLRLFEPEMFDSTLSVGCIYIISLSRLMSKT